jgi:hypothetical protein
MPDSSDDIIPASGRGISANAALGNISAGVFKAIQQQGMALGEDEDVAPLVTVPTAVQS